MYRYGYVQKHPDRPHAAHTETWMYIHIEHKHRYVYREKAWKCGGRDTRRHSCTHDCAGRPAAHKHSRTGRIRTVNTHVDTPRAARMCAHTQAPSAQRPGLWPSPGTSQPRAHSRPGPASLPGPGAEDSVSAITCVCLLTLAHPWRTVRWKGVAKAGGKRVCGRPAPVLPPALTGRCQCPG